VAPRRLFDDGDWRGRLDNGKAIYQMKPLPKPGAQNPAPLAFKLHHAGRRMGEAMDAWLAGHAITVGQGKFLRHLSQAPDGLTPAQLAERCGSSRANVTQMLARLQSAGHVTRRDSEEDGRSATIFLTRSGKQALDAGLDALVDFEKQLRAKLGESGCQKLWTLLHELD
jgi:DNA-binding MarR family transcriptional regulator